MAGLLIDADVKHAMHLNVWMPKWEIQSRLAPPDLHLFPVNAILSVSKPDDD